MKARGVIVVIGLIGLITFACKKDIRPTVVFTVEDTLGNKLENARVLTHPCFDGVSCDTTKLNENFIKEGFTNGSGQLTYIYPYSAIIDVIAQWTNCDTANGEYCLYVARTVARFETVRTSKDEANEYNVKIVVKEEVIP